MYSNYQLYYQPPPKTNKIIVIIIIVFICVIIYIILTSNKNYNNNGEFYSECNFQESKDLEDMPKKITITNITKPVLLGNVYIKSIKSKGCKLFLYEEYDFKGEPLIIDIKSEYIKECFEKPIQSIKIFIQ
jgi:YbbR domain-containing protein